MGRVHKWYVKVNLRTGEKSKTVQGRPKRFVLEAEWPENTLRVLLEELRTSEYGGIEIFKFPSAPSPEVAHE